MKKEEVKVYKVQIFLMLLVFIGLVIEMFCAIYRFDEVFFAVNPIICFLLGTGFGFNLLRMIL